MSYTTSYLGGYKAINLLSEVVDEGYYGVVLGGWGGETVLNKFQNNLFFSIIINQRWEKNDMLFSLLSIAKKHIFGTRGINFMFSFLRRNLWIRLKPYFLCLGSCFYFYT